MERWGRFLYQPCLPLGKDGNRVTGCEEHIALSRKAATETMVLLKNEQKVLPLAKGTRVALFGKGCVDYVKGGGGSGDVTVAYVRSLLEGMRCKAEEGKVSVYEPLAAFYEAEVAKQYAEGIVPGMTEEPEVSEELLIGAKAFTDTAIISICRFSGENWDRTVEIEEGADYMVSRFQQDEAGLLNRAAKVFEKGDFYLSKAEQKMVDLAVSNFKNVIVVMNVGGVVDSCWFKEEPKIQSVLMAWQGGMEGGLAAADLLCGDAVPSGKLVDTFAKRLADYPSSDGFHESEDYVDYTEDIYVGYRYFETIPEAYDKVNYPFGYGLSYTQFELKAEKAWEADGQICVDIAVTNTGDCAGKEVVQVYYSAPQGKLGKPNKVLGAFKKTRTLVPGETQLVRLQFAADSMASYDDIGKVQKSAYVLEAGAYVFWYGTSVRDVEKLEYEYIVEADDVTEQLSQKCAPFALKQRMLADGSYEALPQMENPHEQNQLEAPDPEDLEGIAPQIRFRDHYQFSKREKKITLKDVADGKATLEDLIAQMSDLEVADLLSGQVNTGVANTFGAGNQEIYGIPNVMTADGPAGLRIRPECGVNTTAWPCATALACSWNTELVETIGRTGALEVKENNIGIWLTPAMNIHRSPLCGRNFEYYSEDPLITGKMGVAKIRGMQSERISAAMKHFCCNNKETNRKASDSRVSERALREIYLKGFEIAVKEAQPWMIMTSYNLLNGCPTAASYELITDVLRGEWGFEGSIVTDWWNFKEHYMEVKAGGDLKMGCGFPERLIEALEKGLLTRAEMDACAKRLLEMILKFD